MIYLDYAATCPVDERVAKKMMDCLLDKQLFANNSSAHHLGKKSHELIELARACIANVIHADTKEIIFTSGATESINLALKGVAYASLARKKTLNQKKGRHIITSKTEHKATLDCCAYLIKQGFEVSYISPNDKGEITVDLVEQAIRDDTILVSIMAVNNETGIINEIEKIGQLTRAHQIVFHVDGAQAIGKLKIDVEAYGIDLLSLSAHKVYGPKGVGALYVRRKPRVILTPLIHGGGQERGLRSGTLATHQIIGMAAAFELAYREFNCNQSRVAELHQHFLNQLKSVDYNYIGQHANKVKHIINIAFCDLSSKQLLEKLNSIALSLGSACSASSDYASHVLLAMGVSEKEAAHAIRISISHLTKKSDIEAFYQLIVS